MLQSTWRRTSRSGRANWLARSLTTKGIRQQKKPGSAPGVRTVSMAVLINNGEIAKTNVKRRATTTMRLTFTSRIRQLKDGGTASRLQQIKAKTGRGMIEKEVPQSTLTGQRITKKCGTASNGSFTGPRLAPSGSHVLCNQFNFQIIFYIDIKKRSR